MSHQNTKARKTALSAAMLLVAAGGMLTATPAHAQVLDCVCNSTYSVGDRVVALVDNPSFATNLPAGSIGTVMCGLNNAGDLHILVRWDNWSGGFVSDANACDCSMPASGELGDWYVGCNQIRVIESLLDDTVMIKGLGSQFGGQIATVTIGPGVEYVLTNPSDIDESYDFDFDATGVTITARYTGVPTAAVWKNSIRGFRISGLEFASGYLITEAIVSGTAQNLFSDDITLSGNTIETAPGGFQFVTVDGATIRIDLITGIAVTNDSDGPVAAAGDLPGSLRQAIFDANTLAGPDTIEFDPSLVGSTIALTEGELFVTESVTIAGLDADKLAISAGGAGRIFNIAGPGANTYTFQGVTLADGLVPHEVGHGGAVFMSDSDDAIIFDRCIITNNAVASGRAGAAVFCQGSSALSKVTFIDCAIVNNGAGQGTIQIADAHASFINTTFSGNTTNQASIWFRALSGIHTASISHCTFADNVRGVFYSADFASGVATIEYDHTIFAGNGAENFKPGAINGTATLTSNGYNLLDDATGDATPEPTDMLNTNPMLGPLTLDAGTFVHPLPWNSPAIGAGDPAAVAGVGSVPNNDHRGVGFPRIAGGSLDIGAVEFTDLSCNPADFNADGVLNLDDIDVFVAAFLAGDLLADLDGSGVLNVDDIDAFVTAFLAGCVD